MQGGGKIAYYLPGALGHAAGEDAIGPFGVHADQTFGPA